MFSTVGIPIPATVVNAARSFFGALPVNAVTKLRNAPSFGIKAVTGMFPSVKIATSYAGFALRTARTAAVTISKFFLFESNEFLAVSTAASEFDPSESS